MKRTFLRILIISKKIVLPGFQGISLYEVMRFFIKSLIKGTLFQRADAMTYRIFIAVVPMLIALFSVVSFLGDNVQNAILTFIQTVVPDYTWPAVSEVLSDLITKQNGTVFSFFFAFGLYFTIIGINAIINIFNSTYYQITTRNFIKQILLSTLIAIILFVMLILVISIFIIASYIINRLDFIEIDGHSLYIDLIVIVKWVLIFFLLYFFTSIFYYLTPAKKNNYKFFSAGSSLASILMLVLLFAINYYFSNLSNYNLIYGSLGTLFAILLWIYFNAVITLIGFDLNVSIAEACKNKNLKKESIHKKSLLVNEEEK